MGRLENNKTDKMECETNHQLDSEITKESNNTGRNKNKKYKREN